MKKLIPVIALLCLMTACKNKKKEETKPTDSTTTTTTTTTTSTEAASGDIPKFSDPEVQKYVEDYTAFVTGYVAAYKTKDYTKIQEWSTKATDLATRSMDISKKLAANPDEATKFSNYMTKLSNDLTAAMQVK